MGGVLGRPLASWAVVLCLAQLPARAVAGQSQACGTYEYTYPYNTVDLSENHFIVLDCSDVRPRGWYYGTSDDFDQGREGYLPGFFVAEMTDLVISGGRIRFMLRVGASEYFNRPVSLTYRSVEQVSAGGNEPWAYRVPMDSRQYEGAVDAARIVLDVDGQERVFALSARE